jgi:hypothetical protein
MFESWVSCRIKSKIKWAFFLSKFPVGSSAIKISGLFIKARTIATLCFSPPDK